MAHTTLSIPLLSGDDPALAVLGTLRWEYDRMGAADPRNDEWTAAVDTVTEMITTLMLGDGLDEIATRYGTASLVCMAMGEGCGFDSRRETDARGTYRAVTDAMARCPDLAAQLREAMAERGVRSA